MSNCSSYKDIATVLQTQRRIWINISNTNNSWDNESEICSKEVNKHMVRLSPTLFIGTTICIKTKKKSSHVAEERTPALCSKQEYNKPLSYYKT